MHFEAADTERFPALRLAYEAIGIGGNMPCILNAAGEVANSAFRHEKIAFHQIPTIIEKTMQTATYDSSSLLETYLATDNEARKIASSLI